MMNTQPPTHPQVREILNDSRAVIVARAVEANEHVLYEWRPPRVLLEHIAAEYTRERATALESVKPGRTVAARYQSFDNYLTEVLKDVFYGAPLWGPEEDAR